jgi:hypothetical protein
MEAMNQPESAIRTALAVMTVMPRAIPATIQHH